MTAVLERPGSLYLSGRLPIQEVGVERLFEVDDIQRETQTSMSVQTMIDGYISESEAINRLLALGHKVAKPVIDDDGVDLIVNYRTTVQVKSRQRMKGRDGSLTGSYAFGLPGKARRYRSNGETVYGRPHAEFADVLMCHARDIDVWWIVRREDLRFAGLSPTSQAISFRPEPSSESRYSQINVLAREAWHVFDEGAT